VLFVIVFALARFILALFFRVEVQGRENVPEGACLVVSNHLSWTDTIFILYALPRSPPVWTMANESSVFNTGWKRWLLPRLHVFPVRRSRGALDEEAIDRVYSVLERGDRVMVFPEGAYGRDGRLRPLKDGIGYFALNSGKPLLPVAISGTDRLRPFSRVRVVIGRPFIPDPPLLEDLKARVRDAVANVAEVLGQLGVRASERRGGCLPWPFRRRLAKTKGAEVVARDAEKHGGRAGGEEEQAGKAGQGRGQGA